MSFLGQSRPYCSLVGSENPFLTDSMYPRYSQEVTWNSHLSARAISPLAAEPAKYFLKMSFVFGNVVGIDENVVQNI